MRNPTVTFVVPCYRLAHFLPDCLQSILSQTYGDFEVLIMDDCSPDETAAVARSFTDPRVRLVRNEPNLGHVRNYNRGISLARGKYIWLISADDYLRRPYVLERYVTVLERHPKVGYTFCSGVRVHDGLETNVIDYSVYADHNRIVRGHTLLKTLLKQNIVLSASGLVRRECYERFGAFPLEMPWAGDWFLWCLFALYYDVAYFSEPMVCYRDHALSMTNSVTRDYAESCCREEISIPWIIRKKAEESGFHRAARECLRAVAQIYARCVGTKRFGRPQPVMTLTQFEASLSENISFVEQKNWIRSLVYAGIGNEYYWRGEITLAKRFYAAALWLDPFIPAVQAKRVLLALGSPGHNLRTFIRSLRRGSQSFGVKSKRAREWRE